MKKPPASPEEFIKLIQTKTDAEIAEEYGVTKKSVVNRRCQYRKKGQLDQIDLPFKPHVAEQRKAAISAALDEIKAMAPPTGGIFTPPSLPKPDIPFEEDLDRLAENFERRHKAHQAKNWMGFNINIEGPFALATFGDPHMDDDGCNWPLLRRDLKICENTPGVLGLGIGDYINNWRRGLAHLHADQEMRQSRAYQAIEWFFRHKFWMLHIKGNHDMWSGANDPLDWMFRGDAGLQDWQARFRLIAPNGRDFKIWAAHSFPGHSIYNPLHSNMRVAKFTGAADVYISGHYHNWATFQNEDPDRKTIYWATRARGYKYIDHYGENLGHMPQNYGASIMTIFDPSKEGPAAIMCYGDLEEGAEFLTWKRERFLSGKST